MKASPRVIEAYKTYLYRKGNHSVKAIEGIKAGQAIDLTYLNRDIAAVEKTMAMCESVALPTYEEQIKLDGLRALRDQLVGREWPSLEDIKATVLAELEKATDLKEKKKAHQLAVLQLAAAKAQLQQDKLLNGPPKITVPPAPKYADPKPGKKGQSFGGVQTFQLPNKPYFWVQPQSPQVGVSLGRLKIEQEWFMRVGMLSNCNVSVLQTGGLDVRLHCKICSSYQHVENSAVVSTNVLSASIEAFCRDHRHDAKPVEVTAGRLFREE